MSLSTLDDCAIKAERHAYRGRQWVKGDKNKQTAGCDDLCFSQQMHFKALLSVKAI